LRRLEKAVARCYCQLCVFRHHAPHDCPVPLHDIQVLEPAEGSMP
jgi:hypothetical protein